MSAREHGHTDGWVHSIETGGTADGPGIRYVLFVAGRPLRCAYCHNSDTRHMQDGTCTASTEIIEEIAGYAEFLTRAKGGMTISGEPRVQPQFLSAAIYCGAKELGLHTVLDTSGFLSGHADNHLLADVDLVLLDKGVQRIDLPVPDRRTAAPDVGVRRAPQPAAQAVWLRYVLVPGLTDNLDEIEALAEFAAGLEVVERVDVLPFHQMAEFKWRELGLAYQLTDTQPPSAELTGRVRDLFQAHGLPAV